MFIHFIHKLWINDDYSDFFEFLKKKIVDKDVIYKK